MTDGRADERVAVVTGAARGIGADIVAFFCEQGYRAVVAVDLSADGLETLIQGTPIRPEAIEPCRLDVADSSAVAGELGPRLERLARVDVLVNNAGISDENEADDLEAWHRVIGANLHGTFYVTRVALPFIVRGGRIVNVSSILGRGGKVRNTAYCASKHGVLGFTKALALDLAPRAITVNAVLPGWVDTPLLTRELTRQAELMGVDPGQVSRKARMRIPVRRFVASREVAELVGFVTSEAAASITAQSFTIDGGYTVGY